MKFKRPTSLLLVVALAAVTASGCMRGEIQEIDTITVGAQDTWNGAWLYVDGNRVAQLTPPETRGGIFETILKMLRGDSPAFHWVAVTIPIDPKHVKRGVHRLRVEKPGMQTAEGTFEYPLPNSDHNVFFVTGTTIELPQKQLPKRQAV